MLEKSYNIFTSNKTKENPINLFSYFRCWFFFISLFVYMRLSILVLFLSFFFVGFSLWDKSNHIIETNAKKSSYFIYK